MGGYMSVVNICLDLKSSIDIIEFNNEVDKLFDEGYLRKNKEKLGITFSNKIRKEIKKFDVANAL